MCRDGSYPLLGGHPGRSRAAPAVRLEPLMGRRVVVPNRNCTRAGNDGTAALLRNKYDLTLTQGDQMLWQVRQLPKLARLKSR